MENRNTLNKLNRTPFLQFQSLFSTLKAIEGGTLNGSYRASFTGPGWLRAIAPRSLSLLHFKGWCGKRFEHGGEKGINLLMRGTLIEKYPFHTSLQASLLDGQTSLAVHYDAGSPFPWGYVIDELRRLDETFILGMTMVKQRGLAKIAFPFLLYPWEDDHGV